MACKYCNFKKPKEGAVYTVGKCPVGKPIARNNHGYVIMVRDCNNRALPDLDRYLIDFSLFGVGICHAINYCPMCGRRLGGDDE